MVRAHWPTSYARILVSAILIQILSLNSAAAVPAIAPLVLSGHGLISPRQPIPDDPLAGLPTDDNGGRSKNGSGASNRACALSSKPANDRDIGDLRAALAFVQYGPASWTCKAHAGKGELRLRINIDGVGTVTAVDVVGENPGMAAAMGKRLMGKAIASRHDGATAGVVVLTFVPAKRP
jgi:hypothetical protein